jgi:RNA polymerase sigma factor (sigma-70 family)
MTTRAWHDVLRQVGRVFGDSDAALLEQIRAGSGSAFEDVVARHGSAIRAICESRAGGGDAAEEAYQRTWLTLHRRAASIREAGALGAWLREVARREADRARRQARRRASRLRPLDGLSLEAAAGEGPERAELRRIVREEVAALPGRLRGPVEMCDLAGLGRDEAARRLGCSLGSLRGRLARGRRRLRARLERRGASPSAMAALGLKLGRIGTTWPARPASAAGVALVVGALAWLARGAPGPEAPPVPLAAVPAPSTVVPAATDDDRTTNRYAGRVQDEAGRPVAGASLVLLDGAEAEGREVGRAGDDGRFDLTLPEAPRDNVYDRSLRHSAVLVAWAEGYGPAWFRVGPDAAEIPFVLGPDAPVSGRVVDPEGKPVAGARVKPGLLSIPQGSLDDYIAKMTVPDPLSAFRGECHIQYLNLAALPWLRGPFVTDAEGRFTLKGLGRERYFYAEVEAPGFVAERCTIVTRPLGGPRETTQPGHELNGTDATIALERGRVIEGLVLDKDDREPVGGIIVEADGGARGVADAEGRFRIEGVDPAYANPTVHTVPRPGDLYFLGHDPNRTFWQQFAPPPADGQPGKPPKPAPEPPPLDVPIRVEVLAPRGVPYRLRLTDAESGEPVEATVDYRPIVPNPEAAWLQQVVPAGEPFNQPRRDADGIYAGAVLPGPGVLLVTTPAGAGYRPARPIDLKKRFRPDREDWTEEEKFHFGDGSWMFIYAFHTGWAQDAQARYQAVIPVEPKAGDGPLELSAVLEKDRPPSGRVVGPGGEPLADVLAVGLSSDNAILEAFLPDGAFAVPMLPPGKAHRIRFYDHGRKLFGSLRAEADDPGSPYTVRLEPWAALTGRLLDAEGRPLAGAEILTQDMAGRSVANSPFVDARYGIITHFEAMGAVDPDPPVRIRRSAEVGPDGSFRLEALEPGAGEVALSLQGVPGQGVVSFLFRGDPLKAGEARDLGDVRMPLGPAPEGKVPAKGADAGGPIVIP